VSPTNTHADDPPHASVIVATYNAQATLGDCLDSLLRLDYPADRLELICVDNASTDATPQLLARYQGRIHSLYETMRGPAAARNRGLQHASGTVVAFTDADCVVDRAWLRHLVRPLSDERVGVAGGRILSRRPCNVIEAFGEQIHDHDRAMHSPSAPYAITMSWASRRDVLERIGRFDQTLLRSSDVDCAYRMVDAGYRLAYVRTAIIYHRNERTPWGLMHEGYVHGFHAPRVAARHAAFLQRMRSERDNGDAPQLDDPTGRPSQHWSDPLWSSLFRFGKRVGRRHAAWTAADAPSPLNR
jgi:cellulose synthase/poly-beta-1,6-N-acetylglucosamine synthase-like glycosyltransferase